MKRFKNPQFLIGALSIMIAAILWSLDGAIIRPQFYMFPALNVVFIEHFLGALVLSPFLVLGWKKVKSMTKKDVGSLIWICTFGGLIGTVAITAAFFGAFRGEGTLATIVILQKLQPIFALFLASILLHEKLTKKFYFLAMIALGSAYFIAFGSLGSDIFNMDIFNKPAFYAFIAAFAFGSSTVFGKSLVDDIGFRETTALRFSVTSILAFIALLLFGSFLPYADFTLTHFELLGVIVFTTGAGALFLYYYGLKKISASAATIFELAWPLSAIFFDYYFNGNTLNMTQGLFSAILIFTFFMIIEERNKLMK